MKNSTTTGKLLILGSLGILIPYIILASTFHYPDILRQEPDSILREFHQGGSGIIFTWLAFSLLGIPLIIAYSLLGKMLEDSFPFVRWITSIGIISGIIQIIGLLRWVFVVPLIASNYVETDDVITKTALVTNFQVMHQFAGVLLGEHLGQLFTVIWTMGISYVILKASVIPRWLGWFGILSSLIYILAQAELLATVIPGFPVWNMAGFIGSTLWLIWLILLGGFLIRQKG